MQNQKNRHYRPRPRPRGNLAELFAMKGTSMQVTFLPMDENGNRMVCDLSEDYLNGIRIFPATRRFRPIAGKTYKVYVMSKRYEDGPSKGLAWPQEAHITEEIGPDEWLPLREYLKLLRRHFTFHASRNNERDLVDFHDGRTVILHQDPRVPVQPGQRVAGIIQEDLWIDYAYAVPESHTAGHSDSTALAVMGDVMRMRTKKDIENVIVTEFFPKEGRRAIECRTESDLEPRRRYRNVFQVLDLPDTASANKVEAATQSLLKKYHPDRYEDAPFMVRKNAEEMFRAVSNEAPADLLQQGARERALALIAMRDGNAERRGNATNDRQQAPSDNNGRGGRSRRRGRRGGRNGQDQQGAATQPAQAMNAPSNAVEVNAPAETDVEAPAPAEDTMQDAGATMGTDTDTASGSDVDGGAEQETMGAAADGTQTGQTVGGTADAPAIEESTPAVSPAIARHLAREERRRKLLNIGDKKPEESTEKATRPEPKKGFGVLASLRLGEGSGD